MSLIRPAVSLLIFFTLLTGVAYPLAVTGVAQLAFPRQANGSLIERDGHIIGSRLIGQPFDDARAFWSRPSAVTYDAAASGASNLGPTNPALVAAVNARIARLRANGGAGDVPIDLVTTSASGLDPHISPEAARYQVPRVARERGVPEPQLRALVESHVEPRTLGIWGEPRVNVLDLNLALDELTRPGFRGEAKPADE